MSHRHLGVNLTHLQDRVALRLNGDSTDSSSITPNARTGTDARDTFCWPLRSHQPDQVLSVFEEMLEVVAKQGIGSIR